MRKLIAVLMVLIAIVAGCSNAPPAKDDGRSDGDAPPPGGADAGQEDGGGSGSVSDPLALNTSLERTTVDGDPAANVTLQVSVNWPDLPVLRLGVRSPPGFEPMAEDRTSIQAPEQGSTHRWRTLLSLPQGEGNGTLRTWVTANQTATSRISDTQTLALEWKDERLSVIPTDWAHDSQGGLTLDVEPDDGGAQVRATLYTAEPTRGSRLVAQAIDGSAAISIEHPHARADGSQLVWRGETSPQGVELSFGLSLDDEGQAQASINFLPPLSVDAAQYSGSVVLTNESGNVTVDRVHDEPPPEGTDEVHGPEGGG